VNTLALDGCAHALLHLFCLLLYKVLGYAMMLAFAAYVLSTDSWLTSKASMAVVAVGFVLLSMLSGFGLGKCTQMGPPCVCSHEGENYTECSRSEYLPSIAL
jgi:hypothetical protein